MNSKNNLHTSRLSKPVAFSAILMALGTSVASAAITISQVSNFPTSPAVTSVTPAQANNNDNVRVDENRFLTQTFQVASGFTLHKLYIEVDNLVASSSFDISIFTVADTNAGARPDDIPTGTNLLATTSATTPGSISGTSGVLELVFTGTDQITLATSVGTAGYAIQFNVTTPDVDPFVWRAHSSGFGTTNTDLYTAGQGYASVLGGGFTHSETDFTLALVPEPSTSLLAAFAASALFLRRRRA